MHRVLLVENDARHATYLSGALQQHGFLVERTDCMKRGLRLLQDADVRDMLLVEWPLPDGDGLRIVSEARGFTSSKTAWVAVLTTMQDVDFKVDALAAGADDVLSKRVDIRELVAKMRAAARVRTAPVALAFGPIRVDPAQARVWVDDREVSISRGQLKLLLYLVTRRPRVITRSELAAALKGTHHDTHSKPIDVEVSRLRKRLGLCGHELIRTVRGVGYALDPKPKLRRRRK